MMKPRLPVLAMLIASGLPIATTAFASASDQSTMPSAAQQPSPATQNATMQPPAAVPVTPTQSAADSTTYTSAQGKLTVNSTMNRGPSTASPPSFEQLSGGSAYITQEQANAYPPLANDFIHVAGHSDRISKGQYEHWLQHIN